MVEAKRSQTLQRLIQEAGLNQAELARRTGVAQPVVHRLCTGETVDPKLSTLRRLSRYFGVTIDALIGKAPLFPLEAAQSRALLRNILSDLQDITHAVEGTIQLVFQL